MQFCKQAWAEQFKTGFRIASKGYTSIQGRGGVAGLRDGQYTEMPDKNEQSHYLIQ